MIDLWEELQTDRLLLRRISYDDVEFIRKHFGDEEVCKYMVDNEPITTIEEAEDLIKWSHSNATNPTNNRWLIVLKDFNQPIGTIGFHRWDSNNNIAEIGYDLAKEHWKKGIMNEAIGAALKFGFKKMKLNRIQAFVHIENIASYNILRKNGFYSEGIIRDLYLFRGKYHDHHIMSLLLKDYKDKL
jgi:ribosomal-protein-alanine N-acetyltransferase